MSKDVRELRKETGLTQKAFAEMYEIPVSTLRKWEQHEATPPDYVIRLIAMSLPSVDKNLLHISDGDNEYFYDGAKREVIDSYGNHIRVKFDLGRIKKHNLPIYLRDLFEAFYDAQNRFDRDCEYDIKEDILWS